MNFIVKIWYHGPDMYSVASKILMMSSFAIVTLLEIPLYHATEGLSLGIPFVHLRPPYILLYNGIGRTVHGNALSDLRPPYQWERRVGVTLSALRAIKEWDLIFM